MIQPGRELDRLVAEAMGWIDVTPYGTDANDRYYRGWAGVRPGQIHSLTFAIPDFSTEWEFAGEAWEWLVKNHPWKPSNIFLTQYRQQAQVVRLDISNKWTAISEGDTYPHAIALAVVAAANQKQSVS
jgi:hypothetical protein